MDLEKDRLWKLLLNFWIPAIVGMVVNALYNVVDKIFVSKGVGELAFAGLTVTHPYMLLMMGFTMLIGVGASSILSIRLGEKDYESASFILGNAFASLCIIGVIFTALSLWKLDAILVRLSAVPSIYIYAKTYLKVILWGAPFEIIGFGMNTLLRSIGKPKLSMISNIIGALGNVVLDALFILVFGWGIFGAALATIISQTLVFLWVMIYFFKYSKIKITKKGMQLKWPIIKSILAIGVSPFSIQTAGSFVVMAANRSLSIYGGDKAISAMGVANSISVLFLMPIFGINHGTQPIIGYNYGAKQYTRVIKALLCAMGAATAICTLGFISIRLFPNFFINFFASGQELFDISKHALYTTTLVLPIIGMQIISTSFYQATNRAKISLFLSLLRQVILLIPLYIYLPRYFGLNGIWYAPPISDAIAALTSFILITKSLLDMKKQEKQQLINVE